MNNHDDDLASRALAFTDPEAATGAERRKARLQATLAAIETDPAERARIDRIAADAGITDQDEATIPLDRPTAEALLLIDMPEIAEARQRQEQLRQLQQDTLDMQDKLIAQGEKMRTAMAQIERHAAAAERIARRPRFRGTTLSQITMPVVMAALIGGTLLFAIRPGGTVVTGVVFATMVGLCSVAYVAAFLMSVWSAIHGNSDAERVLRLLMGSLSVEERLAEANGRPATRALHDDPPDDSRWSRRPS